jgi:hypothetical protein
VPQVEQMNAGMIFPFGRSQPSLCISQRRSDFAKPG